MIHSTAAVPADVLISFEQRPSGREVAMLGAHEVGVVAPSPDGRVCWQCWLPGPLGFDRRPRRASNVVAARALLERHVMDWIDAGGLAPALRAAPVRYFRGAARI